MSKILPRRGVKVEPELVSVQVLIGAQLPDKEPVCPVCHGKGTVPGLLQSLTCHDCHGTGIDLRYAVEVIKRQRQRLEKAEKAYRALQMRLKVAVTPPEKLMGEAVEAFYKDSKINKYD